MKEPEEMRSINHEISSTCCKVIVLIFFILTASFPSLTPGYCDENTPSMDFLLSAPADDRHKQYLGLSSDKDFSPGEIKARVVIIEIYSMYCPYCQHGAPDVNALYNLIQSRPTLKDKIKLIGIGAGNTIFEVNFFREKYNVEFPLFSDTDFSIHKKVGQVRTPHFFGLLIKGKGQIEIFYSKTGEFSSPEIFLQTILSESGIKE
ncbi:MAG: TlpA disulfide reductase family protein [Desulfobacula sp.]